MKLTAAALALLVILHVAHAPSAAAQAESTISADTAAKVVQLLESTGYRYTKVNATVWTVAFQGAHKSSVSVIVFASNDTISLLSVIAEKAELPDAIAPLRQLLKTNTLLDGPVIILDQDDDYVVRGRYPLRPLTAATFKAALQAIALASDDAFGAVQGYVVGGATAAAAPSTGSAGSAASAGSVFSTPRASTREAEILNGKAAISFNPAKWKETTSNQPTRLSFQHVSGDGYALIIPERIQVPVEQLREIAISNAREASPDIQVVEEQRRRVNGAEVLLMRLEGKTNGIAFTYLGYYYGGEAGTVQIITYTGQNLFGEYRRDFEDFLNGFHTR